MAKKRIDSILAGRSEPQDLIEVLQDVQAAHGHVSQEAMRAVSAALRVPLIEVFRAVSFYKAFTMTPRGEHVITVCSGTACHVRGAPRLLDEVSALLGIRPGQTTKDGVFSLERVNCLGACALGPVLVLDGVYHGKTTPAKLRKLLAPLRKTKKEAAHA